jgi:RecA-family ATPase
MATMTLESIARALGGEVSGCQVLAPGPGHSPKDRSLSIKLSRDAPEGFIVHSFCGDDPIACRDYVRRRLGMDPFKPNVVRKTVATYEFRDPTTGEIRYRKERVESADGSKSFFFKPKGRGGSEPLLYGAERLADVTSEQPVFVVEGEKKVDRLRGLGAVAVSGDSGFSSKWLPAHADLLRGLPVILWPDSDEPGEGYIARAATCLTGSSASVRIVRPFGPPNGEKGRDVCDWHGNADDLATLVANAKVYAAREEEPFINGQAKDEAKPLPVLRVFNPADWEGRQAPRRLWIVPDYIPDGTVTLLYADGGTGKSYLELQLAVARAVSREWIGLMPEPGRTLVLSTEDDLDEMWRRIEGMLPFFGARMADLGDIRLVDLVGENSVLGLLSKGIIEPTPMYSALNAYMAEFKPGLVELDVLADLFSGDEIKRPQVTQFIGLLKRLCRNHHCAILLLAHPSLTGMNTGTGTSGSTGWNNAGRSRLYFQKVKTSEGDELDKNLRTFEGKKSNYGEVGGKFDVEWKEGLFRRVTGPSGFDKLAADRKAEDDFLAKLKAFAKQGRNVSDKPSISYAPTAFSTNPGEKAKFAAAMSRLFDAGKLKVETIGSPSHQRTKIVENG